MVGTTGDIAASDLFKNLVQGVDYDFIYEYTGGGYVKTTALKAGKAYFIKALKNVTWTIAKGVEKENVFVYDSDGERIRNTLKNALSVAENDTVYVSDKYELETTPADTTIRKHIFMGDRRVCTVEKKQSNGSLTYNYLLPDHLGSSDLVTDSAGAQIETTNYSPYGSTITDVGSYKTKYKFNGKELDSTNLYYYGARYYAHDLGRFISVDTIDPDLSDPQTLNKYAYCLNNPLKYIDPDGHEPKDIVVGFFSAAVSTALAILNPVQTGRDLGNFAYDLTFNFKETTQSIKSNLKEQWSTEKGRDTLIGQGLFFAATMFVPSGKGGMGESLAAEKASTVSKEVGKTIAKVSDDIPEKIYRGGGTSPSDLKLRPGEEALSFRDSLSNPVSSKNNPVFKLGKDYIEVDTSQLPKGSVVRDNVPPGHVSVKGVSSENIKNALTHKRKLPKD